MKYIKYTGTSDFQEFGAADFKKQDVEAKKIVFARDEVTEVPDEVAEVLLSTEDDNVFGQHSFKEASEEEVEKLEKSKSVKSSKTEDSAGDSSSQTATGSLAQGTGGSQSGQGTGPAGRQGSSGAAGGGTPPA